MVKMMTGIPTMSDDDVMGGKKSKKEQEHDAERLVKVRMYMEELEPYENDLTPRQYEFLQDMKVKVDQYGDNSFFTDKQYGWLKGLWEKVVCGEDDQAERSYRRRGGRRR